jgi:hypothetical protein
LARAVLDALTERWPVGAAELPERRYVAFGEVAIDCEQITVSIERTFTIEADAATEVTATGALFFMRAVEVTVQIARCIPTVDDDGNMPRPEDIEVSAAIAAQDEQNIRDALIDAQQEGDLASCNGIALQNWTAVGPDGGFGGGRLGVLLALA